MRIRFVILATPRTGSNWLCTLLDSHPDIMCHHELFNPQGIHVARSQRENSLDFGDISRRDEAPLELLRATWSQSVGFNTVGFKLNIGQSPAVFDEVLSDPDILKIVITRKNYLRSFVSEKIARTSGEWENYIDSVQHIHPSSITVTVEELTAHITRNDCYYDDIADRMSANRQSALQVEYESLSEQAQRYKILNFLGVDPEIALHGATRRTGGRPLEDAVSNYDELLVSLSQSDIERYISSWKH